jgi:ribonuclease HII
MELIIAGIDEAGVGPLAGPVIAGAVILNPKKRISGIADSKQLTEKKREALYQEIQTKALAWSVGRAEIDEIDRLNILQATLLAMQRAIQALSVLPDEILIDGKYCPTDLPCPARAIIEGDRTIRAISAASIMAKVTRDREMLVLDKQYPQYGFAQHKGYGTKLHLKAIRQWGISPVHRRSFAPVRAEII